MFNLYAQEKKEELLRAQKREEKNDNLYRVKHRETMERLANRYDNRMKNFVFDVNKHYILSNLLF